MENITQIVKHKKDQKKLDHEERLDIYSKLTKSCRSSESRKKLAELFLHAMLEDHKNHE